MSFQYIPFQFSGLPRVHCAFQMRTQANIFPNSEGKGTCCKNAFEDNYNGNISFATGDEFENVIKNRKSMQAILGIQEFAELKQIHSDVIVFNPQVTALDEIIDIEADGMATNKKQLALMIKTADCQSILIAHKDGNHIMGLHAGWRGNRMYFPENAIEKFCYNYKLDSKDLLVVRGPSLGPNLAEFTDFEKDWSDDFRAWYNEKNHCMNLWDLTKKQLLNAGLLENNIYSLDLCTATMNNLFFSYRKNKNCGRQASLIWIE